MWVLLVIILFLHAQSWLKRLVVINLETKYKPMIRDLLAPTAKKNMSKLLEHTPDFEC